MSHDNDSKTLLTQFSRDHSEAAFRELVQRHSAIVYSTALRKLNGDRAAAEDVMQEVFTLLVRKAPVLGDVILSAWLYRQACRRASNHARGERRRRKREMSMASTVTGATGEPWEAGEAAALSDELDGAILSLPARDRDAVTMRFFEGRDYRSLGSSLGLSEEAARKRVTRALDKLAAILKRKGIVTGAVALGSTLTGMAATQPPATVVSRVAARALKTAPAGSLAALYPLLKSFLAGLLAVSVTGGAFAALRSRVAPSLATTEGGTSSPGVRGSRATEPGPFDEMISGIKRLQSGPDHAMTGLRLRALLGSLPADRIPGFFAVAETRLSPAEKTFCYSKLTEIWRAADAPAAMTFALDHGFDQQVDSSEKGMLVLHLFDPWCRDDLPAARAWLLSVWDHENLKSRAVNSGTLGDFLAKDVANQTLKQKDVAAAFQFVATLPAAADRAESLKALSGDSAWHNAALGSGPDVRLKIYQALKSWPDPQPAAELSKNFMTRWIREAPGEVEDAGDLLSPLDRFQNSMLLIKAAPPEVLSNDGFSQKIHYPSTPVAGFREIEEDCLDKGLEAGLTRGQALEAVGAFVVSRLDSQSGPEATKTWQSRHAGEVNLDSALVARARRECSNGLISRGESREATAIRWASLITDPALRMQVCRAAFRRMLVDPTAVGVKFYVRSEDLPADLTSEFQRLLDEQP